MRLPRNLGFEGNEVVPVAPPPDKYFDDAPDPIESLRPAALSEALRVVVDLLDGPARGLPSRVAALKKLARGSDAGGLRDLAKSAGCSPAAVHAALRLLDKKLKTRT
jgi:hypothetical protein